MEPFCKLIYRTSLIVLSLLLTNTTTTNRDMRKTLLCVKTKSCLIDRNHYNNYSTYF